MNILAFNFKTYPQSAGPRGLRLAKTVCRANSEHRGNPYVRVIIAPQAQDLALLSRELLGSRCEVFAQHIDSLDAGAHTGYVTVEGVKSTGATGTILNHSEHRLPSQHIKSIITKAKEYRLETLLCAKTSSEGAKLARLFAPTMLAVEPPELIGGDVSVTTAHPRIVSSAVKLIRAANPKVKVLVGAGVRTPEDVRTAIGLGADGVLLSSGLVKSRDPLTYVRSLLRAMGD